MARNAQESSLTRLFALVIPLVLAAAAWYTWQAGGSDSAGTTRAAVVSQSLPRVAASAAAGNPDSVHQLIALTDELDAMQVAGSLPGDAGPWNRLLADARGIIDAGEVLTYTASARDALRQNLPDFVGDLRTLLVASGAVELVEPFERQSRVLESLDPGDLSANSPQTDQANAALVWFSNALAGLGGDVSPFDITPLPDGPDLDKLAALRERFDAISTAVAGILRGAGAADTATGTLRSLASGADAVLPNFAGGNNAGFALPPLALPVALAVAALLSFAVAIALWRTSRTAGTSQQHAAQNDRNQQAILRLLDELGSLADGDLTVQATVTEDITGAIADSINYAIEALRGLVATINDTAIMVDSAAKQTEAAAGSMSKSARQQAHEVKSTTDELGAIVAAIEEVSGNAERSSDVARHSVDVAHKGGEAVRRTIDGMNAIRETIQETSKRIKRLGESSQEIGNIVELINDIAEQTNILALNASIQASMAGEAGRGFAVVADEVQRLAERSTNATKQIEVLVRTIQADTNEAVVSMERSTTDVVGGALLAENAGAALDEIEQVSNQIASLVQNISTSAREQSSLASHIDKRTMVLRKISDITGRETAATTAAIRKLAELATQLRGSVAGFQLPDAGETSGAYVTDEELADHGPAAGSTPPAAAANAQR